MESRSLKPTGTHGVITHVARIDLNNLTLRYNYFQYVTFIPHTQEQTVKSGIALCRCVAFMSVSIIALLWAYKRGRHQRRSDASGPSSLSTPRMTLAERQ